MEIPFTIDSSFIEFRFYQESKYRYYYACSNGLILSKSKKDNKDAYFLKSKIKGSYSSVKINGKDVSVNTIIVKSFFKVFFNNNLVEGWKIKHKQEIYR